MEWSVAAVSLMIAGVLLCCGAFVPRLNGRDRVWAGLFGVAAVMAGLDTADQPGGSPVYPLAVLVLAVAASGYLGHRILRPPPGR